MAITCTTACSGPGWQTAHTVRSYKQQGTRELVAKDFGYALKRDATTRVTTPIFSVFADYVMGVKDYGDLIKRGIDR